MADTLTWTPGVFTILRRDDKTDKLVRRPLDGLIAPPFAINYLYDADAWNVTHTPTGRRVWTLSSLDAAKEFCGRILPLLDWRSFDGQVPVGAEIKRRIHDIAETCDRCWGADEMVAEEETA